MALVPSHHSQCLSVVSRTLQIFFVVSFPCCADFLADYAVFVLGRVENDGLKLAEVDIACLIEDALVGTHVDNLTNNTVNRDLYLVACLEMFLICSASAPEVAFVEGFDYVEVHDFVPLYGFNSSLTATISWHLIKKVPILFRFRLD